MKSRYDQTVSLIKWVMTHYGSDAGERIEPGSKLQSQAERIAKALEQLRTAEELLADHGLDLVQVSLEHG